MESKAIIDRRYSFIFLFLNRGLQSIFALVRALAYSSHNADVLQRACLSFEKAGSPHLICYASGSLLFVISNRMTSIFTSVLHFGQYKGNRKRTVSSYTFVRVLPPHFGQRIQRELFSTNMIITAFYS